MSKLFADRRILEPIWVKPWLDLTRMREGVTRFDRYDRPRFPCSFTWTDKEDR